MLDEQEYSTVNARFAMLQGVNHLNGAVLGTYSMMQLQYIRCKHLSPHQPPFSSLEINKTISASYHVAEKQAAKISISKTFPCLRT